MATAGSCCECPSSSWQADPSCGRLLRCCRLEELNEKRQSMVSKLKGVEKELSGATSCCLDLGSVCHICVHGVVCGAVRPFDWLITRHRATALSSPTFPPMA
jgi:hypothetical protein